MQEDTFKGSVLYNQINIKSKEFLSKYRSAVAGAVEFHQDITYTDSEGNEYKGSKFWRDALEHIDGILNKGK